jgi:hypothetical protein
LSVSNGPQTDWDPNPADSGRVTRPNLSQERLSLDSNC